MKMKLLIMFLVIGVFLFPGYSEESTDLQKYYDSEFIKLNISPSGDFLLSNKGITSGTLFGLNHDIQKLLETYPESKIALGKYNSKARTGNLMLWGGFGIAMGSLGYFTYRSLESNVFTSTDAIIFTSVLCSGTIIELIGLIIVDASYQDLCNSVNIFNRNVLGDY
jgi:hypothetical protein